MRFFVEVLTLFRRHGLSTLILLLLASTHSRTCAGSDLEAEMRSGLHAAKALFENCSIQATVRLKNVRDVTKPYVRSYRMSEGRCFLETSLDPKSNVEIVKGLNNRYAFAVTKPPKQDGYSLLMVLSREEIGRDAAVEMATLENMANASLFHTYFFQGWRIWDLIDDSGFELVSIERLVEGEVSLVKTTFKIAPTNPTTVSVDRPYVGYFVCRPDSHWAMVEYYVKDNDSDPYCLLKTIELGDVVCGLPTASKVWESSPTPSPSVFAPTRAQHSNAIVNFEKPAFDDAPVSEEVFFLSPYGLPEPKFASRWLGPWIWYLAVGIVLAMAGAYLLRRRQHVR